ncbi:MAG: VIT1/CCC1 transporter family protein [Pseudomonadota bacterium]
MITPYRQTYLADVILGGIDGCVTTFAIVAAATGAGFSGSVALILGIANLLADGFSMAVSNFEATKSRHDLGAKDKKLEATPLGAALATFLAFLVIGFLPLLPFLFALASEKVFWVSCVIAGIAFMSIGLLKGWVIGHSYLRSGVQTLLMGGTAAAIAYFVGQWLQSFV